MPKTSPIGRDEARWETLRAAIRVEHLNAEIPAPDRWRSETDEALWRGMVGQVVVIGSSMPWEKAVPSWGQSGITWHDLSQLPGAVSVDRVASLAQRFMVRFGVRYAGRGETPSRKATAVARNYLRVRAFGGPKAVMHAFAAVPSDEERIALVRNLLEQFGPKGARDFLMGAGMLRDRIAIDDRVESVLYAAGLIPTRSVAGCDYLEVEQAILDHVARPLGLEGVAVDRTMYQRRDAVLDRIRLVRA